MLNINREMVSSLISVKTPENITFIEPIKLDNQILTWFREVEIETFEEKLRYSFEEIEERMTNPNSYLLILLLDNRPIALHLGYELKKYKYVYYIDTLASIIQNKGFGSILLKGIEEMAKKNGYSRLQLDTEKINAKGLPLVDFYSKHGFSIINIKNDNITMDKTI